MSEYVNNEKKFTALLNSIITESKKSKNNLIKETGIDRSTFFQILSGKRIPTDRQFGRILRAVSDDDSADFLTSLPLSYDDSLRSIPDKNGKASIRNQNDVSGSIQAAVPAENDRLRALLEEYLSIRLEGKEFRSWKIVQSFVDQLNMNLHPDDDPDMKPSSEKEKTESFGNLEDPGPWNIELNCTDTNAADRNAKDQEEPIAATAAVMAEFIAAQKSGITSDKADKKVELDFYLSPSLVQKFQLGQRIAAKNSYFSRIRQIIGADENNPLEVLDIMLQDLAELMVVQKKDSPSFLVYRMEDSARGKQSQLFPYYLLGKSALLLISSDGTACSLVKDLSLIDAFHKKFDETVHHLDPLFQSVENYEALSSRLFARYRKMARKNGSMLFISDRPCALQLASEDIIDKYIENPLFSTFAKKYVHNLQKIPGFCGLMSEEGLFSFESDGFISESGIDLQLDKEDMQIVNQKLGKMLGRKMIIVPFPSVFIHGWELAIYDGNDAILALHASTKCIIHFHNQDIIHALFLYYDSIRKILQEPETA